MLENDIKAVVVHVVLKVNNVRIWDPLLEKN